MPHRARRAGAKSSMDEFLDELKKRETLRSFGADVDGPAPPRAAPPAYEGRTEGTGYQGTTNLCVNNLAATVTEEKLMQVFGAFGDIFSVKVMWPRSEDERRRGRNRGFVSFRTREDADEALNALDETSIEGVRIAVSWGKALKDQPGAGGGMTAAQRNAYSFGGQGPPAAPPAKPAPGRLAAVGAIATAAATGARPNPLKEFASRTHGVALPAAAPTSSKRTRWDAPPDSALEAALESTGDDATDAAVFQASAKIVVAAPPDERTRRLIDATALFTAADGRAFEEFVRVQEGANPEFAFLSLADSDDGRYYRWRVYEACMAAQGAPLARIFHIDGRDVRACRIQRGGPYWVAPDAATTAALGAEEHELPLTAAEAARRADRNLLDKSDENALYARRGARTGDASLHVSDAIEFQLQLSRLTPSREKIRDAMVFALQRADACREIAALVVNALADDAPTTAPDALVARLYLVSDVLHNSAAPGRGARLFRGLLRPPLPGALHRLGARLFAPGEVGVMEAARRRALAEKVATLLNVWLNWSAAFPPLFVFGLESCFFEHGLDASRSREDDDVGEDRAAALRRDARFAGLWDDAPAGALGFRLARLRKYVKHRTLGTPPAAALAASDAEQAAEDAAPPAKAAARPSRAAAAAPAPGPARGTWGSVGADDDDDEDVDGEAIDDLLDDVQAPAAPPPAAAAAAAPPAAAAARPPAPPEQREARGRDRSRSRSPDRRRRDDRRRSDSRDRPRDRDRRRSDSRRRRRRSPSSSRSSSRSSSASSRRRSRSPGSSRKYYRRG